MDSDDDEIYGTGPVDRAEVKMEDVDDEEEGEEVESSDVRYLIHVLVEDY